LRIYGFSSGAIKKHDWQTIENKDWLEEWKKHWKPTETEKFIIAPSWEKIESAEKTLIRIEPNMAFGTGTHETTRLCLRAIEENYTSEMSFLDVGTGTGILAIAASKLEAQSSKLKVENSSIHKSQITTHNSFLACDTDADSIKIARENAALNETSNIEFYVGSIDENTPPFDFVCANLTADVIVPLLPLLTAKYKEILVLSGILREQETLITNDLKRKFHISNYKIERDGEWISILLQNDKKKTK
jgi:ribosomal protein L11 methyltransferase